MSRRNLFLLLLALVLLALDLSLDPGARASREAARLFPQLVAGRASRIRIEEGTSAQGAQLLIERTPPQAEQAGAAGGPASTATPARGAWLLADRHEHPADDGAVLALLDRLRALDDLELAARGAAAHAALGVDARGTRVVVQDDAGRTVVDLVQGGPLGSEPGTHVRRAGDDEVYRARGFLPVSAREVTLLPARWLEVHPVSVRRVRLAGEVDLELSRPEDIDRWSTADGRGVERAGVRRLLDVLAQLRVERVIGRGSAASLGDAAEHIEVQLEYSEGPAGAGAGASVGERPQLRLVLARAAADGEVRGAISGKPWVVSLPPEAYDALRTQAQACAAE